MIKKHICVWTVILLGVLLLLPVLPAFSSDVSDADFYGVIQTSNNATAATGVITTITGMNTTALIAGGFSNATANNSAIQSTTSADMPFMPGYGTGPWVMYNGGVGANTIVNSLFYTKNVTGGDIVYFNGATGMAINDHASMEQGSNFTQQINTHLDAAGTVIYKPFTEALYYDGSANLYYDDFSSHIVSVAETEDAVAGLPHAITMPGDITAGNILLMCFAAQGSGGFSVSAGWTLLNADGNGMCVTYYKVAAGGDTCTVTTVNPIRLAAVTYNIIAAGTPEIATASTGTSTTPDPPSKTTTSTPVNKLWIAFEGNGAARTVASYVSGYTGGVNANTLESCVGTCYIYSNNSTINPGTFTISASTLWGANTVFVPLLVNASNSELAAAVTDGRYTIEVTSSAAGSAMSIDGAEVDTGVALSITDTAGNYQIGSSATLYIDYFKHYVGGVLKSDISWEYPSTAANTITNGTGTATGSPKTLAEGANTITITGAGTFTVTTNYGWRAIAASGTATVTTSPVTCESPTSRDITHGEIITVTGTGNIVVTLYRVFVDQSANSNNPVPSFRTTGNDADVSSELILFQPVTEPTAPAFAVGEGPDFISGNLTATETPNPVSGNGSLNYPGKGFIDAMGAAGDFPEVWLPTFIAVFILLALSVTASYFLKESGASSLFVKSVVNIVGYGVLVSLNIFDWWMLIFFFIFEQAIWFAAKERRE